MYIFTNSQDCNEMFNVLPTDHWELCCTHDAIYLVINDAEYLMYSANDLYSILVAELCDAVIGAAIACIKRDDPYIDISELYDEQLAIHKAQWHRDGDIPDEA